MDLLPPEILLRFAAVLPHMARVARFWHRLVYDQGWLRYYEPTRFQVLAMSGAALQAWASDLEPWKIRHVIGASRLHRQEAQVLSPIQYWISNSLIAVSDYSHELGALMTESSAMFNWAASQPAFIFDFHMLRHLKPAQLAVLHGSQVSFATARPVTSTQCIFAENLCNYLIDLLKRGEIFAHEEHDNIFTLLYMNDELARVADWAPSPAICETLVFDFQCNHESFRRKILQQVPKWREALRRAEQDI